LPEACPPFVPPERYHGQLELPAPVEEAEALLFGARRLVVELAGFLQGRGAGVTRLRCDLVHEDEAPTSIVLGLKSTRQVEHIMTVLRERLAREALPDRVEAIRLVTEEIVPLTAKEGDFFAVIKDAEAGAQLIERLRARLGEDAVRTLSLNADHRPERAGSQTTMISDPASSAKDNHGLTPVLPVRPLWLLPAPYALAAGPAGAALQLESGPERIESGWWDGGDIGRDYFVGRNAHGEELWLYRDREGEWFVHGVFS
jgi:protein ImuB